MTETPAAPLSAEDAALLAALGTLAWSRYIPHTPTPPQYAFLLAPQLEILFGGGTKGGKALRVDEPIVTPTGWTTMGALRAGDQVVDERLRPCRVLVAHPVLTPPTAYRVTFDDGVGIEASGEHLWWTATRLEQRFHHNTPLVPKGGTRTTAEIAATLDREHGVPLAGAGPAVLPCRTIVACDPVAPTPMRCITVDSPSHLYLAGPALLPTHNSDALLMAALQYVDVPGYAALLLRQTFKQLSKPDMLIPRSHEWLARTAARWNDDNHEWTFPSGAKLSFGYIEHEYDELNFQGSGYQFIGWDELTQHPAPRAYQYMFSRLTRPSDPAVLLTQVPLRVRATANPGGPGEEWVQGRFFGAAARRAGRLFIPALLADNPHVDAAQIRRGLAELDDVTRAQLEYGLWGVRDSGDVFDPRRFRVLDGVPTRGVLWRGRAWDKAATAGGGAYTVGLRLARVSRAIYGVEYVVEDVVRGQWAAGPRELIMQAVAGLPLAERPDPATAAVIAGLAVVDDAAVRVFVEQEPGSGGKESAQASVARLAGRIVTLIRPDREKVARAQAVAAQVGVGNVGLVAAPWNTTFSQELAAVPYGVRWDQVDTLSMAFNAAALVRAASSRPAASPTPPPGAGYRAG